MWLQPTQNCMLVLFGRDWCRGPHAWELGVYWNRRDLIAGEPLTEGELIYMDQKVLRWYWPRKRRGR
jgi:hypothetical protein